MASSNWALNRGGLFTFVAFIGGVLLFYLFLIWVVSVQ